jgi:hypothetical protein
MIWQDGISNYMNAYNIFWENGVWRNGNWYGSQFEYRGKVEDPFAKEILNRSIEWSGTSSCHIWNLFETDADTTLTIVNSSILRPDTNGGDSFTTNNVDDAGYSVASISDLTISPKDASSVTVSFKITSDGGVQTTPAITDAGVIFTTSTNQNVAVPPNITVSSGVASPFDAGTRVEKVTNPAEGTFTKTISGLNANSWYTMRAYAINSEGVAYTIGQITFQTIQANTVTIDTSFITLLSTFDNASLDVYNEISLSPMVYEQGIKTDIKIRATYGGTPAPTSKGIVYFVKNIGDTITDLPTFNDTKIPNNTNGTPFITTISNVIPNKVYYIRAFATNGGGTGYSDLIKITSGVDKPVLGSTTNTGTDLQSTLTSTGGPIGGTYPSTMERGFIISSTPIIVTSLQRPSKYATTSLTSTGGLGIIRIIVDDTTPPTNGSTFTKNINLIVASAGLNPGTPYRAVAYAYNTDYDKDNLNSYDYSSAITFTTLPGLPTVTTIDADTITNVSAKLKGNATTNGAIFTDKGFIYTTTQNYTYPDPSTITTNSNSATLGRVTSSGSDSGTFNNVVNLLNNGQKYYFKAYAVNSTGLTYGEEKYFTTLAEISLPLITNISYSDVTRTLTVTASTITNTGNSTISGSGLCYHMTANNTPPTISNSTLKQNASNNTPFDTDINFASAQAGVYCIRAYVTNAGGTAYSTKMITLTLTGNGSITGVPNLIDAV